MNLFIGSIIFITKQYLSYDVRWDGLEEGYMLCGTQIIYWYKDWTMMMLMKII